MLTNPPTTRFAVLIAATRGVAIGEWCVFAIKDTWGEADQCVRDQRWIDSRPPKQRYLYRITEADCDMANPFQIKLWRGAIRSLTKADGTTVAVEIEGVTCRGTDGAIYDVRELATRIGYPAAESDLKPWKPVQESLPHP